MALFIGLNLRGVGEAGGVEVFLVWFKLVVLVGLAGWGLALWDPPMLSRGVPDAGIGAALFGAASVFMAFEGFQLLTYDYEVALAIAGRRALGTVGLVVVTIAAAFSTGSAINATLFATARLANKVAEDGELPAAMDHKNGAGIPDRAVIGLGAAAAVLAAVGTLTTLVEAASLTFLFTFVVVCGLAFYQGIGLRVFTGFGVLAGASASVALMVRLIATNPLACKPFYFYVSQRSGCRLVF